MNGTRGLQLIVEQDPMLHFASVIANRMDVLDVRQSIPPEWADPVVFAQEALGHKTWDLQEDLLRYMAETPRARCAVKACHASSKTFAAAELLLWWIVVHPDGVVITTGPKYEVVERQLWAEVHKALRTAEITIPDPNLAEIRIAPDNWAKNMSAAQAESFQGWHGHVLVIIDEAPGVRGELFRAIRTSRAGGDVRILMLGNPTEVGGPYYDAFTDERSTWKTFTISAYHTPNFQHLLPAGTTADTLSPDEAVDTIMALPTGEEDAGVTWPELCLPSFAKEMLTEGEGKDGADWESRIMAQFPSHSQSSLVHLGWLEAAELIEANPNGRHAYQAGIDVAGPGEAETVIYVTCGPDIVDKAVFDDPDARGPAEKFLMQYRDRLSLVNVDSIGIGWYFCQHLADKGFPVQPVNVGDRPTGVTPDADDEARERFRNLKAQLYWGLRERFAEGRVRGLTDRLTSQQVSSIRWRKTASGQIEIESKEKMAKRGVASPDRAESLMLAFAPNLEKVQRTVAATWRRR